MHNAWGSWYLDFLFPNPLVSFGKAAFWLHTKTSLRFVWAVFVETVFIFLGSTIDNPIQICFTFFCFFTRDAIAGESVMGNDEDDYITLYGVGYLVWSRL